MLMAIDAASFPARFGRESASIFSETGCLSRNVAK